MFARTSLSKLSFKYELCFRKMCLFQPSQNKLYRLVYKKRTSLRTTSRVSPLGFIKHLQEAIFGLPRPLFLGQDLYEQFPTPAREGW